MGAGGATPPRLPGGPRDAATDARRLHVAEHNSQVIDPKPPHDSQISANRTIKRTDGASCCTSRRPRRDATATEIDFTFYREEPFNPLPLTPRTP